jgi:flagellar biosynthesis/type III secretory pathway protein FliH
MDLAEQAARIRLMQEREREMAANREAMAKGRIEQNYRQGYEAGLKQGFDDGRDATLKDFRANFLMLEQTIIRKMANILFTTENPDEFRNMIAQNEQGLKEDPDDNVKKVLLILSRYRLAELVPPQAPATKKKKPKT